VRAPVPVSFDIRFPDRLCIISFSGRFSKVAPLSISSETGTCDPDKDG